MSVGDRCGKALLADGLASPPLPFRRKVVIALGAGAFGSWIDAAFAQPARKPVKVGILTAGGGPQSGLTADFKAAMRDLGWVENRNVEFIARSAKGDVTRIESLAAELAKEQVAVIFAPNGGTARQGSKGAPGTPFVFAVHGDPVGGGIVASLARPGGNITGFSTSNAELQAKRVQFLRDLRPRMQRLVYLRSPAITGGVDINLLPIERAARDLRLDFRIVTVERAEELNTAFDTIADWKAEGLVVAATVLLVSLYRQVVEQAARIRLPAIYARADIVTAGGLMSYAPDFADQFRRAAGYVDRILKGAKPADLPVQQPTKFELVINMKTAKALGLTIPQTILVITDRVIE